MLTLLEIALGIFLIFLLNPLMGAAVVIVLLVLLFLQNKSNTGEMEIGIISLTATLLSFVALIFTLL